MVLLRSYKTPFYTLLAYSLVWDALSWIAMYIVFRGSKTPIFFFIYDWIPQTGWIPTTLIFLNSYTLFVQWFLSHMLTFNRFVFCLNPVNYEKIWNKMFSSIIIFAHVYPLFCTWFFIYYGGYCQRVADYYLIDKNSTPIDQKSSFTRSSFYQLIVSAFNGLTALPMNMYILWTLLNRRKNHQKLTINQGKQPRDAEINLSIFTIILFLIAAITISCQAYYFVYSRDMIGKFVGVIPLVFIVPTLVLDVLVLMVLLRSYKTPFYTLLAYSLVWDALSWIAMYIVFRGSKTPIFFFIYDWIPQTGWIPTTLVFINGYNLYVQWFLSHMLTFNRFVFCLSPVNYEKVN
uniref:Serpentine receptor class gamma n=1 Tax=Ditylenchus dipsaci TaxID=166011 RepID=A0A915D495_9BILA